MVCCALFGMTEVSLNFKQTFLEAMAKRGVKLHTSKKLREKNGLLRLGGSESERAKNPFFSNLTCEVLYGFVMIVDTMDTRNMFTSSVFRRAFF